jgi:hypothetical protein
MFEQMQQKHQKRISVSAQQSMLLEDHLLPMMQVQDKHTGEIVAQVFNFVDSMGGPPQGLQGK